MKLKRLLGRRLAAILPSRRAARSHTPAVTRIDHPPQFPSIEGALKCLRNVGFAPQLAIDIGAYKGEWTRMFRRLFPECHVVMVEAQESKRAVLEEMCAAPDSCASLEMGLLGARDNIPVRFMEMETGSSVFEERSHFGRNAVTKQTITLDRLLSHYDRTVDMLKLDVQGYELEVLRGGLNRLHQAQAVLMEASLVPINEGCPSFADCIQFMNDHDFQLFDFCSQIRRQDGVLWQTDLLFVRRGSRLAPEPRLTPENWA